jgi:hypothetical protein
MFVYRRMSGGIILQAPDTDPKKLNVAAARTAATACSNAKAVFVRVRMGPTRVQDADAGTHSREENKRCCVRL